MSLILHQPKPVWGLPNMSPFCVKLETYLRMAKIEYTVKPSFPNGGPKGKIPFVSLNGEKIGDSSLIIEQLKKEFGDRLDKDLSPIKKAQALAIQRIFEDHLYFIGAYLRWSQPKSWEYLNNMFKPFLPPIVGPLLLKQIRRNFISGLKAHGVGRHNPNDLIQFGKEDLDALSIMLGESNYFLGEQPTSIDATAYGFLIQQIWVPWDHDLKNYVKSKTNLVRFCETMRASYWPEYVN